VSEQHYTYRVEWSPEDGEWVGLVAEFPSLSWLAPDPVDAMRGVRDLVDEVVADMRETGETPPESLAERRYSGKVFLRTSPELHRRLTIEAAEQGVSVNQWALQKLAERHTGELALLARPCLDAEEGEMHSALREAWRKQVEQGGVVDPRTMLLVHTLSELTEKLMSAAWQDDDDEPAAVQPRKAVARRR
jgi:predicted HicB family RNase H-like nuclease